MSPRMPSRCGLIAQQSMPRSEFQTPFFSSLLVLEVRVLREDLLEVLRDRLGLGLLDLLALGGTAKLAPDAVEQLVAVVVHVREDALARLAREDVLDARAALLVHAREHLVRCLLYTSDAADEEDSV